MGIVLPNKRNRQPQSAIAVDWSNPITKGLVLLAMPGVSQSNLVSKIPVVLAGGGNPPIKSTGIHGIGAYAADSTSYITTTAVLGAAYTVFAFGEIVTLGTQGAPIDDDDGSTRAFLFRVGVSGGPDFIPFDTGNSPLVLSGPNFTAAQLAAGVCIAGTVDASGNAAVWGNGIKTTGSLGAAPRIPSTTIALLNRKVGGTQIPTTRPVYLCCGWNRVLSDSEIISLSANPWQVFETRIRSFSLESTATGIAFDAAANSGYQVAQTTYTFNRTVTGANTFLAVDVEILSVPGTTVTGVTDDGVAMTFIGAKSTVSGAGRVECWGIVNPTAGTKTISVTLSASVNSAATAASYTGVNQIVPTEAFNSAQATNVGAADATVSITSVADNCWVHGACATDDGSITAGQTSRNNVSGAAGSGADEDNNGPVTPPGAATMSYTGVGALATWAIAGYAIRPVAASSPATGTVASTLGNVTMAAAGTVTDSGAFASTLGNVTMAAAGTVTNLGAFASTLGNVTMAASGDVAGAATGTFAATLGNVTMSAGGISGNPSTSYHIITRRRLRSRSRPTFGA